MKTRMFIWACIGAAAAAHGAAFAQATANPQLQSGGAQEVYSVADIVALLGELEIAAERLPDEAGSAYVRATTDGGAPFVVSLLGCADLVAGTGCQAAALFTGLPNAGMTYDYINSFNGKANVARAVNLSEEKAVLFGVQTFFKGGVAAGNMRYVVLLFLSDMQTHLNDWRNLTQSVSFGPDARRGPDGAPVNAKTANIGQPTSPPAKTPFGASRAYALDAAIDFSWNKNFVSRDED